MQPGTKLRLFVIASNFNFITPNYLVVLFYTVRLLSVFKLNGMRSHKVPYVNNNQRNSHGYKPCSL